MCNREVGRTTRLIRKALPGAVAFFIWYCALICSLRCFGAPLPIQDVEFQTNNLQVIITGDQLSPLYRSQSILLATLHDVPRVFIVHHNEDTRSILYVCDLYRIHERGNSMKPLIYMFGKVLILGLAGLCSRRPSRCFILGYLFRISTMLLLLHSLACFLC